MDYTTAARLKLEKGILENVDDPLLALLVKTASRDADRFCTGGVPAPDSDNYFQTATVTDEQLRGWLNMDGSLTAYLHKPRIASIASWSFKLNFLDTWQSVDTNAIEVDGSSVATAHIAANVRPCRAFYKITYTGGIGATQADLPDDFVEAVTADAIRIYQENKAGIADAIGTAETGVLVYSKSMPVRVQRMFAGYMRTAAWHSR